MTTLLIEPTGGIAGDMLLAALLDLDDPRFTLDHLRELGEELVPGEARLEVRFVERASIRCRLLSVTTGESGTPPHRRLADLQELLERSTLSERARQRAGDVLLALARAEANVHGIEVEEVHFHEVGAVDTLIDVAGVASACERLGVERLLATPPLLGSGTVRCAHGELPVPAPAVCELLRGWATRHGGDGERTTPTGAALLTALCEPVGGETPLVAEAIGYGAGARETVEGPPNLVRVQLASTARRGERAEAWLLEFNLDDMPPEEVGHAVGALRAAGALEVWTAPVQMKKDRPGTVVCALGREVQRAALEQVAFDWTTTLGVRWTRLERAECDRDQVTVEAHGHPVRVKLRKRPTHPDSPPFGERDLFPEHDDLAAVAEATGHSLRELRRTAIEAAMQALC